MTQTQNKVAAADIRIYADQSIALITPVTPKGRDWCDDEIFDAKPGRNRVGQSIPCELRYIQEICSGMLTDGLVLEKDGMRMFEGSDGTLLLKPFADETPNKGTNNGN
jgi:hypothetical protein